MWGWTEVLQSIAPSESLVPSTACKTNAIVAFQTSKWLDEENKALPRDGTQTATSLAGPEKLKQCKWNGWGYTDTYFMEDKKAGYVKLTGRRYANSDKPMRNYAPFMALIGIDTDCETPAQAHIDVPGVMYWQEEFISDLKKHTQEGCWIGTSPEERLFHGHGHTCQEVFILRHGKFDRLPDVVLYPSCHEDVEVIVGLSIRYHVVLIPFGGGTSVTMGLLCPSNSNQMIASVDMTRMNRILWLNKENLTACIEAGATGKYIESQLALKGFTLGHQPDSYEFSTLGGWIATRASGMKMNTYGNIEDLVLDITFVTPRGTHSQESQVSRISGGPDINQLIIGSEGILGMITKAIVKIRITPQVQKYGCIVFPKMELGILFMRDIAKHRMQPTSIRLVDNFQFRFGVAFRCDAGSAKKFDLVDAIKKFYLFYVAGFHPDEMVACTLLFEGDADSTAYQEKRIYKCGKKYMGIPGGARNGENAYHMIFLIAYVRDFTMNYGWIFESFESTLPWDRIVECCHRVRQQIDTDCKRYAVPTTPIIMIRLSQAYDDAGVLYFYFGFNYKSLSHPMEVYGAIEENARSAIMDCGGSISHHHGVGKLRKQFLPRQLGPTGMSVLQSVKNHLDPTNVFGSGNLM